MAKLRKKGVRNMRSTFNILFYVNKSKEKNGVVPVMGRVTINGTKSQFSCKKTIPLDMWDVKGNCAKGRSKEALQINRDLDNIKAQIIKHYQHLCDREAFVTAEMVRNSYQGFGSEYETLLNAFDKDIASLKKRVGAPAAKRSYQCGKQLPQCIQQLLPLFEEPEEEGSVFQETLLAADSRL
jgi:hypothetical protein